MTIFPDNLDQILSEYYLIAILSVIFLIVIWLSAKYKMRQDTTTKNDELEHKLDELTRLQIEMTGRMQTMAEIFSSRQMDMSKNIGERIDNLNNRLNSSMIDNNRVTQQNLGNLQSRLGIVDQAQKNIIELSQGVLSLQDILANIKSRGLFGQGQMETIIKDGMPETSYSFQTKLSNGSRPDCIIKMPNKNPSLIVDAKFPLEAFQRFQAAKTRQDTRSAERDVQKSMVKHISDIASKYIITGETQEIAMMFIPSESLFADLHEHFGKIIDYADRSKIIIVSPSLLKLSIQVIRNMLKDSIISEQAHNIRTEMSLIIDQVELLDKSTSSLQKQFSQSQRDVDKIITASDKLVRHGDRLKQLDFKL